MKKGFTLIELLAVIIILSLIMIMAVPAILTSLNNVRVSAFVTEVQQIYKAAQHQYTVNAMMGASVTCFNSTQEGYKIQTSGEDLNYSIKIQSDGTITSLYVYSPGMHYSYLNTSVATLNDITSDGVSQSSAVDNSKMQSCTS